MSGIEAQKGRDKGQENARPAKIRQDKIRPDKIPNNGQHSYIYLSPMKHWTDQVISLFFSPPPYPLEPSSILRQYDSQALLRKKSALTFLLLCNTDKCSNVYCTVVPPPDGAARPRSREERRQQSPNEKITIHIRQPIYIPATLREVDPLKQQ